MLNFRIRFGTQFEFGGAYFTPHFMHSRSVLHNTANHKCCNNYYDCVYNSDCADAKYYAGGIMI